jgi:hypothetical protein
MYQVGDATLTAQSIIESYLQIHENIYGWRPSVVYRGNQWYQVENQVVHRSTLLMEIQRLHGQAEDWRVTRVTQLDEPEPAPRTSSSVISRLIARLRKG